MNEDFISTATVGGVHRIDLKLPEMLDSDEFDLLNDSLLKVLDTHPAGRWVLNLTGVDYMGSSVLGLMINIRQHVKTGGGQLVLSGPSPRLSKIFKTCCLERLFTITKTADDGVKWYLR